VFGYVTEGQEVVNAIVQGDKMETITIERIGKEAKKWDAMKVLADNAGQFRAR
jgi:cyclophilin family peptidyl-prolyl cis-trans isomerase